MRRAARADHDAVPNEQRYRHHRRLSPALQKFKEAREEAYRRRKEERHDPAAAAARRAREAEEKLLREAEETGVPVEELKRRRAEAPTADGSENPKPEHNNLKTKHNRRNK